MNFKVNEYTTINNFKRLGEFETFSKFGVPQQYEKISGFLRDVEVEGYICMASENIYRLTTKGLEL